MPSSARRIVPFRPAATARVVQHRAQRLRIVDPREEVRGDVEDGRHRTSVRGCRRTPVPRRRAPLTRPRRGSMVSANLAVSLGSAARVDPSNHPNGVVMPSLRPRARASRSQRLSVLAIVATAAISAPAIAAPPPGQGQADADRRRRLRRRPRTPTPTPTRLRRPTRATRRRPDPDDPTPDPDADAAPRHSDCRPRRRHPRRRRTGSPHRHRHRLRHPRRPRRRRRLPRRHGGGRRLDHARLQLRELRLVPAVQLVDGHGVDAELAAAAAAGRLGHDDHGRERRAARRELQQPGGQVHLRDRRAGRLPHRRDRRQRRVHADGGGDDVRGRLTRRGSRRRSTQFHSAKADNRIFVASIPSLYRMWSISKSKFGARLIWASAGICQSMLANPSSTTTTDENRRLAVQARVNAYNAVLATECARARTVHLRRLHRRELRVHLDPHLDRRLLPPEHRRPARAGDDHVAVHPAIRAAAECVRVHSERD